MSLRGSLCAQRQRHAVKSLGLLLPVPEDLLYNCVLAALCWGKADICVLCSCVHKLFSTVLMWVMGSNVFTSNKPYINVWCSYPEQRKSLYTVRSVYSINNGQNNSDTLKRPKVISLLWPTVAWQHVIPLTMELTSNMAKSELWWTDIPFEKTVLTCLLCNEMNLNLNRIENRYKISKYTQLT